MIQSFVRVVEGSKLSVAAVQVDKTWTKRWQEAEAVVNYNDTKVTIADMINKANVPVFLLHLDMIDSGMKETGIIRSVSHK